MNWYITKIVFSISSEGSAAKNQFDEQLRLVCAEDSEEAFFKARTLGLAEEETFYNDKLRQVKWEFINVSEVLPISRLDDGAEIYSRIHETNEARDYVQIIHQKAIALRRKTSLVQ